MNLSPSDKAAEQMFDKEMGRSGFACVPRHLVEAWRDLHETPLTEAEDIFVHFDRLNAAAREIAEAALDDIT